MRGYPTLDCTAQASRISRSGLCYLPGHDITASVLTPMPRVAVSTPCAPCTPNCPQARCYFHCKLRPGPIHSLADGSFIHPLAAPYVRSYSHTQGHRAALCDDDKRRNYYADHGYDIPGYPIHVLSVISFETLRQFSPGAMQPVCDATRSPNPGAIALLASPMCVKAQHHGRQLSVVQCRCLYRKPAAAAGLHTA
jgi:hypothetical protein